MATTRAVQTTNSPAPPGDTPLERVHTSRVRSGERGTTRTVNPRIYSTAIGANEWRDIHKRRPAAGVPEYGLRPEGRKVPPSAWGTLAVRSGLGAVCADADQGDLFGGQAESQFTQELPADWVEDVAGHVEDGAALAAAQVQVPGGELACQVVRRTGAAEVDVCDQAELAQCVQSAVHGRAVDARAELLGAFADLLGAQVFLGVREHLDDGEPGRGDPLAAFAQPFGGDFCRALHWSRHGPSLTYHRLG
jgi:hypothetical protein